MQPVVEWLRCLGSVLRPSVTKEEKVGLALFGTGRRGSFPHGRQTTDGVKLS